MVIENIGKTRYSSFRPVWKIRSGKFRHAVTLNNITFRPFYRSLTENFRIDVWLALLLGSRPIILKPYQISKLYKFALQFVNIEPNFASELLIALEIYLTVCIAHSPV